MSETIAQAADVKILTRNPLIPWKRLVEMNLNSMSFSNGADTAAEKGHGSGFNVRLGSVPEYLRHKISESGGTLDVSGGCYKYLVTENSNDHLDRDNSMERMFGNEQNELKTPSKEKHNKSICLNEGMYTEGNMEVRPDSDHQTFVTNEVDFKLLSDFKDGVNNLNDSDAQTIYNMAMCESELNFEQEPDSTYQIAYCYKNSISCLDDQRKIYNLNHFGVLVGEYDKDAATEDKISEFSLVCDTKQTTGTDCNNADFKLSHGTLRVSQDVENTFDAYSEKNCSRFDDSGIVTHTDGLPCSLNENTLRETDIDGEGDWDLSFDDETCPELCSDDNDGVAVFPTEKTYQLPNVLFSERLSDIPLDSNLTELETSRSETMNKVVDNVTLPEIVAGHCLVEDRHESHFLNRSARQAGHYCNDKEDYEHPSPQLNCQPRVHETYEPYAHSDISDEIKGDLASPFSQQLKENYHGLKESDNRICTDDNSETVRALSLVIHHGPDFVNGTEITYHCESELETTSQDVAVHLRGMSDLNTCINNEIINTDGALEFSCDDIGSENYNHENVEKSLNKNVCVVDAGAFEYNQKNPAVLSYTVCSGSDTISTMKEYLTSTYSITNDGGKIKVCCSGDLGSKWGLEECSAENFLSNMEKADVESLINIADIENIDENIVCELEYGNFEVGDRSVCDELDLNSDTSLHESHSHFGGQFDKVKSWKGHEFNLQNANLKRLTRDPLTCWQRLVDINIESMLSTKHQCVEGAVHSSGEESKQIVKYPAAVNKPDAIVLTDPTSHLEDICSCDKYKLFEDMDGNYCDINSSIFDVSCGALASSDTKIDRDKIREGGGLKITLEHEMSPKYKNEVKDDGVKEDYISTESEIGPNVSQDNLSQSCTDLSFAHSHSRVNIFFDQEESEEEFHDPNLLDGELDFPPIEHYSSDTASEIASLALDTYAIKIYDSLTSLQANGNLPHDMSESMTKTEQVNDDLGLRAKQLSLVRKINSSLTGVKRNIRKHVQSRQEKIEDWNSENKIAVERWLNMLGKWGKKECNILLSAASQTPEHSVRLVLGREVNENLSTECRNKRPKFDSFHSVPDTQFKAQISNVKLCDQGSQVYRPFNTTDAPLESHPHKVVSQHHEVISQNPEVVSQHQILGFEVNIDEPIQHKSLGDDYNSIESKQSWELCKKEDSYSHKDACVSHGAPSSGWTWFTNVVTKMVTSIKSSEPTRDEDMESSASNTTDNKGLQDESNNVEVFPRNYLCAQKYPSEIYKSVMEDCPQEVSFVETNEIYDRELASGEKSDISFIEYISRHAVDNEWIRKHLNSTKTTASRSAINNSDDDMATTVQMVVDPRRGVRNPKLKTAYAFIRGRIHAGSSSADTQDRSSVIPTPIKSEHSFNESVNTFEGPVNASLKLKNSRIRGVLKQKKNRKKNQHAFSYREKISRSKDIQNPKQASDSSKSERRPPHLVKPFQRAHEKIITPPRNSRLKTRLDKMELCAKITGQGNYEVCSSGRQDDASSDETSSGEYSSEITFKDKAGSSSGGCVIDIKSVSNEDVLSEFFRNQGRNIKPMVTTKETPKIPLYALTLPSVAQRQTSQDMMSARDLVSSPVSGMTRAVSVDVMSVDTMESGDAMLRDDLFQSSLECLLEMLLQRGKVNHAFVASIEGKILAKTSGLTIPTDDVMTLICSLTSNYSGSVKLSLMTFTYTCFKDELNSALIGKAENSIFVARLGSQNIVVGFTDPCTPGSCIREIQELSTALSHRGL